MVPAAPGTAAPEVARAEVSVLAGASVLEESGAAKEESGAAPAGSERSSPARHPVRSPSSRQLRANVGPQRHPLFRLPNPDDSVALLQSWRQGQWSQPDCRCKQPLNAGLRSDRRTRSRCGATTDVFRTAALWWPATRCGRPPRSPSRGPPPTPPGALEASEESDVLGGETSSSPTSTASKGGFGGPLDSCM